MFDKRDYSDYKSMIPEKYKNKKLSKAIFTTFSLGVKELEYVYDDLRIRKNPFYVFYDGIEGRLSQTENSIFSGSRMIPVHLEKYAFHPKVLLLKYEDRSYVIIVSSRNITSQEDQMNGFAVAYGSVDDSTTNSANGKKVADFLKKLKDLSNGSIEETFETEIKELEKVDFSISDGNDVDFLSGCEVDGKLKELGNENGLIIVSPFLNMKTLKNYSVAALYAYKKSYGEFREFTKCYKNDDRVHAKIYCWKNKDKTHWIIGSSNATYGGLKNNIEFNIYFTTNEKDYENFKENLNTFFTELEPDDLTTGNTDTTKDDLHNSLLEWKRNIRIEQKQNQYTLLVGHNSDYKPCENFKYTIAESDDYTIKKNVSFESDAEITSRKPFQFIKLRVCSKDGKKSDEDNVKVYDIWDKNAREKIDAETRKNRTEKADRMLKYKSVFISGRKAGKKNGNNASYSSSDQKSDRYVFLCDRYRNHKTNKDFWEKLEEIRDLYEDGMDKNNPDDCEWVKFLNNVIDFGKGENNNA